MTCTRCVTAMRSTSVACALHFALHCNGDSGQLVSKKKKTPLCPQSLMARRRQASSGGTTAATRTVMGHDRARGGVARRRTGHASGAAGGWRLAPVPVTPSERVLRPRGLRIPRVKVPLLGAPVGLRECEFERARPHGARPGAHAGHGVASRHARVRAVCGGTARARSCNDVRSLGIRASAITVLLAKLICSWRQSDQPVEVTMQPPLGRFMRGSPSG